MVVLFCFIFKDIFLWEGNFYPHTVLRNPIPKSLNILDHEYYPDSVKSTRSSTTKTESLKIPTKINELKNGHTSMLFGKMLENLVWTGFIISAITDNMLNMLHL